MSFTYNTQTNVTQSNDYNLETNFSLDKDFLFNDEVGKNITNHLKQILVNFEFYHQVTINGLNVQLVAKHDQHGLILFHTKSIDNTLPLISNSRSEWIKTTKLELNKVKDYIERINDWFPEIKADSAYPEEPSIKAVLNICIIHPVHNQSNSILSNDISKLLFYPLFFIDPDCANFNNIDQNIKKFITKSLPNKNPIEIYTALHFIYPWIGNKAKNRIFVELSKEQKELTNTRTKSGYRRITGGPGTGKSLVLACRAVKLLTENKRVLIITFNTTAYRYLSELIYRHLNEENIKNYRLLEFSSFHHLLLHSIHELKGEDINKWLEIATHGKGSKFPGFGENFESFNTRQKFDAVIVDEAQDLTRSCIQFLRKFVKIDGEFLIASDSAQNIYGRPELINSDFENCGFRGSWKKLHTSYRMPPEMIDDVDEYLSTFFPNLDNDPLKKSSQQELALQFEKKWIQLSETFDQAASAEIIMEELDRLIIKGISLDKICILVQTKAFGLIIENACRLHGINFFSTINKDDNKSAFSIDIPLLKICTIKSFKGIEANNIILAIEQKPTKTNKNK